MNRLDDMEARLARIETVLGESPAAASVETSDWKSALALRLQQRMREAGTAEVLLDSAVKILSKETVLIRNLIREALTTPVRLADGVRVAIVTETEHGHKITRVVLR